ncbi:hypothetical protein NL676_035691 [Syzygium grande]|nr:hypothetical protein NL676_035691 [Syzygium grande]
MIDELLRLFIKRIGCLRRRHYSVVGACGDNSEWEEGQGPASESSAGEGIAPSTCRARDYAVERSEVKRAASFSLETSAS